MNTKKAANSLLTIVLVVLTFSNTNGQDEDSCFSADLDSANAVFPVEPSQNVIGKAYVRLNVNSTTVTVRLEFGAYVNSTNLITKVHLHEGDEQINGEVVASLCGFPCNIDADGTSMQHVILSAALKPNCSDNALACADALFMDPLNFYVDVHTEKDPGGLMRDQLVPLSCTGISFALEPVESVVSDSEPSAETSSASLLSHFSIFNTP